MFFAVRYRQFPVARLLPEGLRASNVFVVRKDGKLLHVKDNRALEQFFKDNVQPILVQRGCTFQACHSPAATNDFKLRSGSPGFFSGFPGSRRPAARDRQGWYLPCSSARGEVHL